MTKLDCPYVETETQKTPTGPPEEGESWPQANGGSQLSYLLVFDGDCGFCTTTARWIESYLPPSVKVEPWQGLNLDELGLTEEQVTTAAYWVDGSGLYRGHLAVGRALLAACEQRQRIHIKVGFKLAGWAAIYPPTAWVARALYRLVAINRHRLPGSTDACRIQPPLS